MSTWAAMAEQGAAPTPASTAGALLPPPPPPKKKKNFLGEIRGSFSQPLRRSGHLGPLGRALLRSGLWRALPRSGLCRVLPRALNGGCAGFAWALNAAGLQKPRTVAGWFWLGPGHSLETGRHLPSNLVQSCLGGPRDGGNWPRARTADRWWRHPPSSPQQVCRFPWHTRKRGDLGELRRRSEQRIPCREEKKAKPFKNGKQNTEEKGTAHFLFWSGLLSQSVGS